MSNYPTGKDNLKVDTSGSDEMTAHAELHNDANAAINAIQDFVGVTASDGSTTVVEGINIIANQIEGLGDALGVNVNLDGSVTINPDGGLDPDLISIPSDATKLDRGKEDNYKDTDDIAKAMDEKFPAGSAPKYADATALGDAVDALAQGGGSEGKFDKGATTYEDAGAMEVDVKKNAAGISDNATAIAGKLDKGTSTYADAQAIQDAIEGIVVPEVDGFVTETELNTALSGKSDTTHDHDGTYQPVGDYATKTEVSEGDKDTLASAKEYADGLVDADSALAGRVTQNETDISGIKSEQITQNNSISGNAGDIASLSNRLDALENTSLSAEWTIADLGGNAPADGELSLNNAAWVNVTVLKFSAKDKNGTEHDFKNVKPGDTIQIGVGASGRAAGSSAAYTVDSVTGGEFGVTHLASTGTPSIDFTAVVAVYPAFDPSNYATKGELDAVKDDKLSKGDGLVATTAKVLEDRINTNEGNITTNATNISTNATNISNNASAILENTTNIESVIEVIGGNVDIDGNITLPDPIDIDSKLDKGTGLVAKDAKELEDAIGTNATNIDSNKENINNLVVNIGGTVDPGTGVIELPNGGKPIDISGKFDAGDTTAGDAKELEDRIATNATNISTNATNITANKGDIDAIVKVIGGDVTDGNITLPGDGTPIDISGKFDKGAAQAEDAKVLEDAIAANTIDIEKLVDGLGGDINNIEVDALPDQSGAEGKFLSSVAGEAVWEDIVIPEVDLDGYATEDYVDEEVKSKVSFEVNANNEDLFCNNIVTLTQAEYDALTDRDPNTLYLAVDA